MRNQNQSNTVNPDFAKTSRKCPPFCIQPSELAPGVKTIAELEVLQFLKKISDGDASMMVIDSRTPAWVEKGIIPGTVNIPWDTLNIGKSDPAAVQEILENQLGAKRRGDFWNFDNVKTLVLFCNGPWCGQSSTTIKDLLISCVRAVVVRANFALCLASGFGNKIRKINTSVRKK